MSIKLKLNESTRFKLYESFQEKSLEEIEEIWRSIKSECSLDKLQQSISSGSSSIGAQMTDVSKLTRVKKAKTEEIVNPAAIAEEAAVFLNDSIRSLGIPGLRDVLSYWKYPIVWSFECQTACTDGVRIAFNPFFYNDIKQKAVGAYMQTHKNGPGADKQEQRKAQFFEMLPFLFVVVHEAYHQIYLHIARERIASFVPKTQEGHMNANYSQDAEINRDITLYHFKVLKKGFDIIQGVDEADQFKFEDWEDIYKAFASGEKTPKWPGYFTNDPTENRQIQEPPKMPKQLNGTVEMSEEYNKAYQETYNKLAAVWNKTHKKEDVLKAAEDMGLEIVI